MFSYIGGKFRISKWIIPFIPTDIETYSETFSGAFWVYMKMDLSLYKNLKTVIYNDVNDLNANLFLCAKQYSEFLSFIEEYPTRDQELFDKFQKEAFESNFKFNPYKADFEKGLAYIYTVTHSFSGADPARASMVKRDKADKFQAFKNKMINPKFKEHLDRITHVRSQDFSEIIDEFDGDKTYFYCDPPYWQKEKYYSNHSFGKDDHIRLADRLKDIKGRFSLSYYEYEELVEWFPKDVYRWEYQDFLRASAGKKGVKQTKATELLIMDYDRKGEIYV